jgi:hypothetical protein
MKNLFLLFAAFLLCTCRSIEADSELPVVGKVEIFPAQNRPGDLIAIRNLKGGLLKTKRVQFGKKEAQIKYVSDLMLDVQVPGDVAGNTPVYVVLDGGKTENVSFNVINQQPVGGPPGPPGIILLTPPINNLPAFTNVWSNPSEDPDYKNENWIMTGGNCDKDTGSFIISHQYVFKGKSFEAPGKGKYNTRIVGGISNNYVEITMTDPNEGNVLYVGRLADIGSAADCNGNKNCNMLLLSTKTGKQLKLN